MGPMQAYYGQSGCVCQWRRRLEDGPQPAPKERDRVIYTAGRVKGFAAQLGSGRDDARNATQPVPLGGPIVLQRLIAHDWRTP